MTPARHMSVCVPLPVPRRPIVSWSTPFPEFASSVWFDGLRYHRRLLHSTAILRHFGPRRHR